MSISAANGRLRLTGVSNQEIALSRRDDQEVASAIIENGPRWIGSKGLLWQAEELFVLDLAEGKLRFLFPEGTYTFQGASPDGLHVVALDVDRQTVWSPVSW